MKFNYYDLGQCKSREVAQVSLSGNAANVRLMDSSNFSQYKNGRKHSYYGGLARKSLVNLQIPRSGHWYVAVDLQGLSGNVRSSVRMLPSPLPDLQEAPLSSLPGLVQPEHSPELDNYEREYDVFISHASEDKEEIVRSLANALTTKGLKVWYDEFGGWQRFVNFTPISPYIICHEHLSASHPNQDDLLFNR